MFNLFQVKGFLESRLFLFGCLYRSAEYGGLRKRCDSSGPKTMLRDNKFETA